MEVIGGENGPRGLFEQLDMRSNSTNNECLIESAINYAKKARFNTDASKPVQMGSITYIFPGQQ